MTSEPIHPITMPKWGMTMTEGKVAGWLKSEGERIEPGEEFVEIETEKITNVVEADRAGVLRRIVVGEGRSAACGSLIAVIAADEIDDAEIDRFVGGFAPAEEEGEAASDTHSDLLEAAGMRIGVVTAPGPQDAPPAILLHGFGSDAGVWMFNQEALATDRTVHALELPSHGRSTIDADAAGRDRLVEALAAAIDALAQERFHLVGHSLGGRLAVALAAAMGDRVASLTLVAPAGLGEPVNEDFLDQFIAADRRRPMKQAMGLLVADPSELTSQMVERSLSYKRTDGVPQALAAIADANLRGNAAAQGLAEELTEVNAPVLIVWGAEDAVLPPGDREALGRHGTVTMIDGAGHLVQMEAATEVNAALAAHWGSAR